MNDFKAEPERLIQQELEAVERVIRSGWYILGREVSLFEKSWKDICCVDYALGVGNGMDALEIGIRALDIGPGDEVIVTSMTAFASVLAILKTGAEPVLADINPDNALLDMESVSRCITSKTKAVLLVHLYGQLNEMDQWIDLCRNRDIYLLEDCAQAHLASWKGEVAGTFGIWGAYSFYPTKNLGAIGDAGALVTNSEKIAEKVRLLRNYGQTKRYYHSEVGLNSRLDELQAAILSVRLEWLTEFTKNRTKIAGLYIKEISNPQIQLLAIPHDTSSHVYHLFVVISERRDELEIFLRESGISSLAHYPVPIHHQLPCRDMKRDPKGLIHAEKHALQCLSLPCHPQMGEDDIAQVIEAVNLFK